MGGQGRSDEGLQFQTEFDTALFPTAPGVFDDFVEPNIDEVLVPANIGPGLHTLNLLGRHPAQPPLFDGQHLWFQDPFGKLNPGTTMRVVGRVAGVGAQIAFGGPPGDFLDIATPGVALIFTYSAFTNTWNVFAASAAPGGLVPTQEVPKVADLTTLPRLSYENGAPVKVKSLLVPFNLDNTSTEPVDGIKVAATDDGIGRWLRVPQAVPEWTAIQDWEVNEITGDDEAQGPLPVLKTPDEWCRRMRALSNLDYGLHATSDITSGTFEPNGWNQAQDLGAVFVFGDELKPLVTGLPVTVATDSDPSVPLGGSQATIQSGAFVWAPYIGKRIVTSGGSRANILADLGGGVARVSEWDSGAPPNTDTFDIVAMTTWTPDLSATGGTANLQFDTLFMPDVPGQDNRLGVTERVALTYCSFERDIRFGDGAFARSDCLFNVWNNTSDVFLHGGTHLRIQNAIVNAGLINSGQFQLVVQQECIQNGGYYASAGSLTVMFFGAIAAFDFPGDAIELDSGALVTKIGGVQPFYGSGNAGAGFNAHDGAKLTTPGAAPNVTGAFGDLIVDFSLKAMPPLEPFAGGPLPAMAALAAWVDLASPATFNGNVQNYGKGTCLITK
jgi:hypothetical protein